MNRAITFFSLAVCLASAYRNPNTYTTRDSIKEQGNYPYGIYTKDANKLPTLVELAHKLNLNKFVKALEETGIDQFINHEGSYTVFAPTDEAFTKEKAYPQEADLKTKIKFHIVKNVIKSSDFKNEETVKTILSDRTIRFNIYQNNNVTANGRTIVSPDHKAHNGVIHIIDRVMSSVYKTKGSVISELEKYGTQYSAILELVKHANLYKVLDTKGPYTFIAPTNTAFEKLQHDTVTQLKKNITALQTVLLGHIVPFTLYTPGMTEGQTVKTVIGNKITISRKSDGSVVFDKAVVTLPDMTAHNGVIHTVDEVLFPEHVTGNLVHTIDSIVRDLGLTSDVYIQGEDQTGYYRQQAETPRDLINQESQRLRDYFNKGEELHDFYGHNSEETRDIFDHGDEEKTTFFPNDYEMLRNFFGQYDQGKRTFYRNDNEEKSDYYTHNVNHHYHTQGEEKKDYYREEAQTVDIVTLLKKLRYTSFANALVETGLAQILNHEGLFTVFAPTNYAFEHPKTYPKTFDLVDRVKFHIARGVIKPGMIKDGDRMTTLLPGRFITFNTYGRDTESPVVLANGRRVYFTSHEARNGVVHELPHEAMDYVYHPDGTLYSEIKSIPRFSRFVSMIEKAGLVRFLVDTKTSYTVLVPSNRVFESMSETERQEIVHELLNHIIYNTYYSEGIITERYLRTLGGKSLAVNTDSRGYLRLDKLTLVTRDFTAVNGVFHEVDRIL